MNVFKSLEDRLGGVVVERPPRVREVWQPFPSYSKYVTDDFEAVYTQIWKIAIIVGIITEKSLKYIVAKGEIARFEQFLLLSRCFQKSCDEDASIGGKWLTVWIHVI